MLKNIIKSLMPVKYHSLIRRKLAQYSRISEPKSKVYAGNDMSILQCCIAYNKYGGFCLPLSSIYRPASQKILRGEVWEPDTIKFMMEHAGKGDIIHAGTYFGDFIPALSRSLNSDAKLWAFEPNPENYRCASITVAINNLRNVVIHNAGLGESAGQLQMMIVDEKGQSLGGASRFSDGQNIGERKYISVDVKTIDDVIPENRTISIIQLDVEGFERQALSGSLNTIKREKPILILENLPDEQWLSENILNMGYRVIDKLHDNTYLVYK